MCFHFRVGERSKSCGGMAMDLSSAGYCQEEEGEGGEEAL